MGKNYKQLSIEERTMIQTQPDGIAEKAGLTVRFLARKVAEYESLTLEIEALKSEMNKTEIKPASIHD